MIKVIKILVSIFFGFFLVIGLMLVADDVSKAIEGEVEYIDYGIQTFCTTGFYSTENTRVTGRRHNRGSEKVITYYAKYLSVDEKFSFEQEIEKAYFEKEAFIEMRVLLLKEKQESYCVIPATQTAQEYAEEEYSDGLLKTVGGLAIMTASSIAIFLLLKRN